MSCVCSRFFPLWMGALFLAGAFFSESTVRAQQGGEKGGEVARILTVDGIKLNAVFYPGGKKSSATVIMLHPIGEGKNIRMPGWKTLATSLQKEGYSVLMFDFRGHGDSTTIDDDKTYFSYAPNRSFKLKTKETIEYKDYKAVAASYLPILVNDIAAVKSFLDRKNDAGACNTSSTIVIGADQGATLGAIWINSEWSRYKYTPPMNAFQKPDFAKSPEGKDIIAAVFLTAQTKLATRSVSLSTMLKAACKEYGMATLLFYGKDDPPARMLAKNLEAALKPKGGGSKKYEFIGAVDLPTKLSGAQLLQDSLDTENLIVRYLEKVVTERGNEWVDRETQSALFMWRFPMPMVNAKKRGEKNLEFFDYQKYVQ